MAAALEIAVFKGPSCSQCHAQRSYKDVPVAMHSHHSSAVNSLTIHIREKASLPGAMLTVQAMLRPGVCHQSGLRDGEFSASESSIRAALSSQGTTCRYHSSQQHSLSSPAHQGISCRYAGDASSQHHSLYSQALIRPRLLSSPLSSPFASALFTTALPRPSRTRDGKSGSGTIRIRRSLVVTHSMMDLPEAGPARDVLLASGGALVSFLASGAFAWSMQRNEKRVEAAVEERGQAAIPEHASSGPMGMAHALELGVGGQKESVEWVNMVFHKIWKVYRRSLEAWLVGLLQPAIDTLPLPSVVRRVEIAEFSLDYEPLSVRNVQRRASRRANDLQYHVGLRYTGDARCLLKLHLTVAGVDFAVPVGVHNLDVDAELWVKLRLTPRQPYVGTLSIAFVRLPTMKIVLAPFRIVNLFAIPFLSSFLSKLLTVDLPRLLVLPRHITFDFLPAGEEVPQHMASGNPTINASSMVMDLLRSETFTGLAEKEPLSSAAQARMEPSDAFVGELSVTLCEARNLPTLGLSVFSNPYCRLMVGESTVESKKNSETSHPAGARDPVWNQDFLFWVEDPAQQKLTVVLRDSMAPLSRNIGFVEVPIWQLQDCAPLSMWLPILQDGPFGVKPRQGEIRLMLTYKSYVQDEGSRSPNGAQAATLEEDVVAYIKVFGSDEGEASEASSDSDSDRERELQRERENKGLDRLGEEPGVQVVATNEGLEVPLDPLEPLSLGPVPVIMSTPELAAKEGALQGVWGTTKAVTAGTVGTVGGLLSGTGGLLVMAGGAVAAGAGGAIRGVGSLAAGVGRGVKSLVSKEDEDPLHAFKDDEGYLSSDPVSIRVRSYPSTDDEGVSKGRGGEERETEGEGVEQGRSYPCRDEEGGSVDHGREPEGVDMVGERVVEEQWRSDSGAVPSTFDHSLRDGVLDTEALDGRQGRNGAGDDFQWDDYVSEAAPHVLQDASLAAFSQGTLEQRVARLVEWDLKRRDDTLLESFASAPRLRTSFPDVDVGLSEERVAVSGSRALSDADDFEPEATTRSNQINGDDVLEDVETSLESDYKLTSDADSKDRWRSVHGAISDLMDFFSR